jgi:hypothetical protein
MDQFVYSRIKYQDERLRDTGHYCSIRLWFDAYGDEISDISDKIRIDLKGILKYLFTMLKARS